MSDKTPEQILSELYYNPSEGLVGATKLYRKVRHLGLKIKDVRAFLKRQATAQQHHQTLKKTDRYFPIFSIQDGHYQADLMFFPQTKRINRGYSTIMTCIEITSRKGFAIPMKNKSTQQVMRAFKLIQSRAKFPMKNLTTDLGSEFISRPFKSHIKKHGIRHYMAQEGEHSVMGMIERYNRTVKGLISKYLTAYKTKKWIDVLPKLISNYNNTFHTSIKATPNEAERSPKVRTGIRKTAQERTNTLAKSVEFSKGDRVRILKTKEVFGKEQAIWSDKIYIIQEADLTSFKVEGLRRWLKHYEIKKVEGVEENPLYRKRTSKRTPSKPTVITRQPKQKPKTKPVIQRRTTRSTTRKKKISTVIPMNTFVFVKNPAFNLKNKKSLKKSTRNNPIYWVARVKGEISKKEVELEWWKEVDNKKYTPVKHKKWTELISRLRHFKVPPTLDRGALSVDGSSYKVLHPK